MKKRKKVLFIILVALGIGLFYNQKNQHEQIYLDNIEALASGESTKPNSCVYSGSIDCNGLKAAYIVGSSMPLPKK